MHSEGPWENLSFEFALCFCLDPRELARERNRGWRQKGLTDSILLLLCTSESCFLLVTHFVCHIPALERVKGEPEAGKVFVVS